MASAVDICNLGLSHIGSGANITAIAPPDGSVEAGRCARFYPLARRYLLVAANWKFATRRATLAAVTNPSSTWGYAYALPSDCLKPIKVYNAEMEDPQAGGDEYDIENSILLTHTAEAVLMYTTDVTDTTKFTPVFDSALGWMIASYLVGPAVKGADGANASESMLKRAMTEAGVAAVVDANASLHKHGEQKPDHISARA